VEDGASISGEEASRWLKDHFAGESDPEITITWHVGPSNPNVYREVLEILFGPLPH
jgi:hypothetical protein